VEEGQWEVKMRSVACVQRLGLARKAKILMAA
jgi:hypothetical protein